MARHFISLLFIFTLFFGELSALAERRVLFVGNSLTHRIREADLPDVVPGANEVINPHFHTNCGQFLAKILLEPDVTCGALKAPYTGGTIYDALKGEPWDAIVFQPFYGTAATELEAIKTMIDVHRCAYPDNRPELYVYGTWPGRPEASIDGFHSIWEQETFSPDATLLRDRQGLHWIYDRLRKDYGDWNVSYVGVGDILAELEPLIASNVITSIDSISAIFADEIHHHNIGHWIAAQAFVYVILGDDPARFNDGHYWYNNTAPGYGLRVLDLLPEERTVIKSVIRAVLDDHELSSSSVLITEVSVDGDEFQVYLDASYEQNLVFEKSVDLVHWASAGQFVGDGSEIYATFPLEEKQAFYRTTSLSDGEGNFFRPSEEKAPEVRVEYQPAELNHIIVAGQSNAVGQNDGAPITVTQPYDNLMFGPMLMWRYFGNSDVAVSSTDTSILDYELWIGSGLRAPMDAELTKEVDGRRLFWGPGGKTTSTWQYERYRQTLQGVGFEPLREFSDQNDKYVESVASTVCNALTRRTGARFFGSVSGISGASLSMIDTRQRSTAEGYPYRYTVDLGTFADELNSYYATGAFAQTLAQVERAQELAAERGHSYKVAGVVWIQGESDNSNANYAEAFSRLVNDYNACIKAITGQAEDVFFFVDSITFNGAYAGQSGELVVDRQLDLACADTASISNDGLVYMVGPRYQYHPPVHYAPQSIVAKGEVIAQAIESVVFRRRPWRPLSLQSVTVQGSDLLCRFHVPVPPLQFQLTLENSRSQSMFNTFSPDYGFQVVSVGGQSILTEVVIESPYELRLKCSEYPAGASLSYGQRVLEHGKLMRGNLCDSHNYPSLFVDGNGMHYDSRNWAMPFTMLIEAE